jgi:ankyrin repeat protein
MWRLFTGPRAQIEETALIWAAQEGQVDCVRLLLDAGADVEAKNKVFLSYQSIIELAASLSYIYSSYILFHALIICVFLCE